MASVAGEVAAVDEDEAASGNVDVMTARVTGMIIAALAPARSWAVSRVPAALLMMAASGVAPWVAARIDGRPAMSAGLVVSTGLA